MSRLRRSVQNLLARLGYQLHKRDAMHSGRVRRMLLMQKYAIDTILDVGANRGQYGQEIRRDGFSGQIISFEPVEHVFADLQRRIQEDSDWEAHNYPLGHVSGPGTINVASNSEWSSLLNISSEFSDAPLGSAVVEQHDIHVVALDDVFDELVRSDARILLKIDAQGYEKHVLNGAARNLHRILGIQVEMSLKRAYAGEYLFSEMLQFMEGLQFSLMSLETVNVSSTSGRIRQVDGIFFREDASQT